MTGETLLEEIAAEAERIRSDGTLPVGFEASLQAAFDEIAADPGALEAEVARRAAAGAQRDGGVPPPSLPRRAAGKAVRLSRRAAGAGRRRVGPRIRSLERRTVERAGRALDVASTELQVVSDTGRRLAAGTLAERGIARAGAASGAGSRGAASALSMTTARALRVGPDGRLADADLDHVVSARIEDARWPVLHAESGDGSLVERLRSSGVDAIGTDPRHGEGPSRRGALEALAHRPRGSLGGVVLSGVPDRVTPASAQALARLVATRLVPGGRVVVLSAHPGPREHSDPVGSDLTHGRPLHPATWCHLFARLGFEEISVRETADGAAYAVGATRAGLGR